MASVMKKYRLKRNLSQEELGDEVGECGIEGCSKVSKGWISQIESGKDNCPLWLTVAIARVLRCNVDTLFRPVVERKTRYIVRRGR